MKTNMRSHYSPNRSASSRSLRACQRLGSMNPLEPDPRGALQLMSCEALSPAAALPTGGWVSRFCYPLCSSSVLGRGRTPGRAFSGVASAAKVPMSTSHPVQICRI